MYIIHLHYELVGPGDPLEVVGANEFLTDIPSERIP